MTLKNEEIDNLEELKIYLLKSLITQAVSYTINPEIENQNANKKIFLTYYVIPQLITAAIASRGVKIKETQCIRYHSVKYLDDYNQYNYVFIPRIHNYRIN